MSKQIEIIVSPQGNTIVTTKGFAGSDCQQASKFLEQALGRQTSERLTPEFYATSTQQQPLREGL